MISKNGFRKSFIPALLALVLLVNLNLDRATATVNPLVPAARIISIAEARSLLLGTVVTIDGAVTVPSGAFSSSTFDQGFAIQDPVVAFMSALPTTLDSPPGNKCV